MKSYFHLAFPVTDLDLCRSFYGDLLGCPMGRSTEHWQDFDFWGHQLSAHLKESVQMPEHLSEVDGVAVPTLHWGLILEMEAFHQLRERLEIARYEMIIPPQLRYKGKSGEQWTLFLKDPFGHALEFKAFTQSEQIFSKD